RASSTFLRIRSTGTLSWSSGCLSIQSSILRRAFYEREYVEVSNTLRTLGRRPNRTGGGFDSVGNQLRTCALGVLTLTKLATSFSLAVVARFHGLRGFPGV